MFTHGDLKKKMVFTKPGKGQSANLRGVEKKKPILEILGLGGIAQWQSTGLVYAKPWVWSLAEQNKIKQNKLTIFFFFKFNVNI